MISLTNSLIQFLQNRYDHQYNLIGKRHSWWEKEYIVFDRSNVRTIKLNRIEELFRRIFGTNENTHLATLLSQINILNKDSLPRSFLEHMKGIWDNAHPGETCPLTLPEIRQNQGIEEGPSHSNENREDTETDPRRGNNTGQNNRNRADNEQGMDNLNQENLNRRNRETTGQTGSSSSNRNNLNTQTGQDTNHSQTNTNNRLEQENTSDSNQQNNEQENRNLPPDNDNNRIEPEINQLNPEENEERNFILFLSKPLNEENLRTAITTYHKAIQKNWTKQIASCEKYFKTLYAADFSELVRMVEIAKEHPLIFKLAKENLYLQLPNWPVDEQHLNLVIALYSEAQEELAHQENYQNYFGSILEKARPEEMISLYNIIKNHEKILSLMHKEGVNKLKNETSHNTQEVELVKQNLVKVLSSMDIEPQLKLLGKYQQEAVSGKVIAALPSDHFPLEIEEFLPILFSVKEQNPWLTISIYYQSIYSQNRSRETLEKIDRYTQTLLKNDQNEEALPCFISLIGALKICEDNHQINHPHGKWLVDSFFQIPKEKMNVFIQKIHETEKDLSWPTLAVLLFLFSNELSWHRHSKKIANMFSSLLSSLENEAFLTFFQFIFEKHRSLNEGDKIIWRTESIFDELSLERIKVLAQLLNDEDRWSRLMSLASAAGVGGGRVGDARRQGIYTLLIPQSDLTELKKIWNIWDGAIAFFSDDQLKSLIESFTGTYQAYQLLLSGSRTENGLLFLNRALPLFTEETLKKMCWGGTTILKLIADHRGWDNGYNICRSMVCQSLALEVLKSTALSEEEKTSQLVAIFKVLKPKQQHEHPDNDEYAQFINEIIKESDPDHLSVVFQGLSQIPANDRYQEQERLVVLLLKAILKNEDPYSLKIKAGFKAFWVSWANIESKLLNSFPPGCLNQILYLINSKELLKTMIDSIPETEERKNLLTRLVDGSSWKEYKVDLTQEEINEVLNEKEITLN